MKKMRLMLPLFLVIVLLTSANSCPNDSSELVVLTRFIDHCDSVSCNGNGTFTIRVCVRVETDVEAVTFNISGPAGNDGATVFDKDGDGEVCFLTTVNREGQYQWTANIFGDEVDAISGSVDAQSGKTETCDWGLPR